MSELSMSLDDYASKNKRKGGGTQRRGQRSTRRPSRGGGGPVFERTAKNLRQTGRRKTPYNKPSRADGRWTNDKYAEIQEEEESFSIVQQQPVQQQPVSAAPRTVAGDLRNTLKAQAAKLLVSNVEKQITEEELLQLFAGIGAVKSITLHFDKDGKSQGTALVNYASKASAELAVSEFSGRMLDGEELVIEFVNSASASTETSKVTIDPLQSIQSAPVYVDNSGNYGSYDDDEEDDPASFWGTAAGSSRSGGNRGARRGRRQERRGNNRRNRANNKDVSPDDLDAQMEAYRSRAKKAAE